jgi:energy-coupling factor transport system permease protein
VTPLPSGPLARRNPVAKLLAALALMLAVFGAADALTPALVLACELAVVPWFGLTYGALWRRTWLLLFGVAGIVLSQILFGTGEGDPVANGVAIGLRLLAVALPGVLVFASTDPTDLADSLIQNARVSPRFAVGTLAAWRLLPLLREEWRLLGMARRARGVDAGRNPILVLRLFASTAFALLVGAIRRGTRLATAMDARGFDSGLPRTIARPQRVGMADRLLVLGAVAVGIGAIAVSVAVGAFRPLFGG